MAKSTTLLSLALIFCMCSPLFCFIAWVYFLIARRVHKYLSVRAEKKRPDLGGEYWVQSMHHLFFSLLLFVIVMVGVLYTRTAKLERWPGGPGFLAFGSLLVWRWYY